MALVHNSVKLAVKDISNHCNHSPKHLPIALASFLVEDKVSNAVLLVRNATEADGVRLASMLRNGIVRLILAGVTKGQADCFQTYKEYLFIMHTISTAVSIITNITSEYSALLSNKKKLSR